MALVNRSKLKAGLILVKGRQGINRSTQVIADSVDAVQAGVDALNVPSAFFTAAPANPTGTTSLTGVMMGLGSAFKITPVRSGTVLIILQGSLNNNTTAVGDGALINIRYGTGTAPANGAAATGTNPGNTIAFQQSTANAQGAADNPFTLHGLATGLTLNTAIWIDAALAAITAGTASITRLVTTVIEL